MNCAAENGVFVVETNIFDEVGKEIKGFSAARAVFVKECRKYFSNKSKKPSPDTAVFLWQRYDVGEEGMIDYMNSEKWAKMQCRKEVKPI